MIDDRRRAALDDLDALERQRAEGIVDELTARRLWVRYAREALDGDEQPEALSDPPASAGDDTADAPPTRRPWSRWASMAAVAAAVVATVTLPSSIGDRAPGDFVTGNEATGTSTGGRDLTQVSNAEMEEVVAANPDMVPMRARLAHRYLDEGELDRAVGHYLEVLDRQEHPEAMSHLGWILLTQGRGELAAPLIDRSLELAPGNIEATWFRANVLMYAQGRPSDAIPLLESLLARDGVGEAERAEVEAALGDALEAVQQQDDP